MAGRTGGGGRKGGLLVHLGLVVVLGAFAIACDRSSTGLTQNLLSCAFGESIRLDVGEVAVLSDGDPVSRCIAAAGEGGEYVLVPFVAGPRDTGLVLTVRVTGGGFEPIRESDDAEAAEVAEVARAPDGPWKGPAPTPPARRGSSEIDDRSAVDAAFDRELREREHRELGPLLRPGSGDWEPGRGVGPVGSTGSDGPVDATPPETTSPSGPTGVPPSVGTVMQLNVSARCGVSDRRQGRVAYVSDHAVVVADLQNPEPGFSDDDYADFGERYDDLVHPVVAGTLGSPPDVDQNERVLLFFTRGVNEKGLVGGVVAGFFWSGDLFPREGSDELGGCPESNEAEILYLGVPDPDGSAGTPRSASDVRQVTMSTVGHELQHLINSGRRIHVNGAQELEESWLNEGLSFIAEELLFYEAAGLSSRLNLASSDVLVGQNQEAFEEFGINNLGRYNLYLQQTHLSSPLDTDRLTTRGASWAFLRYLADRDPGSDADFFRELVNSGTAGLANLGGVLGEDPLDWMADWGLAVYADDRVDGEMSEAFSQPSWNYADLVGALREDGRFPIRVRTIASGGGIQETLRPTGATSYTVFRIEPEGRAMLEITSERTESSRVRTFLMRVR